MAVGAALSLGARVWNWVKIAGAGAGALGVGEVALRGPENSGILGLWQNTRDALKITEGRSGMTAMFAKLYQFIVEACDFLGAGENNFFRNYAERKLGLNEGSTYRDSESAAPDSDSPSSVSEPESSADVERTATGTEITAENDLTVLDNYSISAEDVTLGNAWDFANKFSAGLIDNTVNIAASGLGHVADLADYVVLGGIENLTGIDTGYDERNLSSTFASFADNNMNFDPALTTAWDRVAYGAGGTASYFIPYAGAVGLTARGATVVSGAMSAAQLTQDM